MIKWGLEKSVSKVLLVKKLVGNRVVENISIHGNHIPEKDFEGSKDSFLYLAKMISNFCKIIWSSI